jgi:hypothetical protein
MTDEATTVAAEAAAPEAVTDAPVEAPVREVEATPRGAIDRAFASLEETTKPAEPTTEDRPRGPDGKFAPKETAEAVANPAEKPVSEQKPVDATVEPEKPATTFVEPPKRFSPDAKAAWDKAPEPVRAEVTRAVTELEKGLAEYQQRWEPLKEYDALARQHGTTIDTALKNYIGIEQKLAADQVAGLTQICENMGFSLRDVAAHVMGQTPDQAASATDAANRQLRQELAALKQELSGVSTTIKSQTEQATLKQIEAFSADKPRFEELSNDIAFFLQNGRAQDLQEAYNLAERLNPAPQAPAPAPAVESAPAAPAQPRKGNLSLSGAPSSGSNPANRKPPSTARDALDTAFARVGM